MKIIKFSIIGLFSVFVVPIVWADRLVLVSASYGKNILAITEANGDVIWSHQTAGQAKGHAGHHDVHMLPNGNTLIASGSGNSVVEVTPDKKVVWEIKGKVPGTDINLKWMTCLQETKSGNFIVGNCHAGPDNPQIFEISREKKVVWEFNEFELVGNGLACWQVLDGKDAVRLREQLAELR